MPIAWCIDCSREAAARVAPVAAAFPGVRAAHGGIDRTLLGERVFSDPKSLTRLERIIHPMVEAGEKRFLGLCRAQRVPIVALDIPLLFESGSERRCDYVVVVSAPTLIQRQRVLRRPGLTQSRLEAILKNQMSDREKRRRADFVVPTGLSRNLSWKRLRSVVRYLRDGRSRIVWGGRYGLRRRRRGN